MKHCCLTLLLIGAIFGNLHAQMTHDNVQKRKYRPGQLYVFKQRDKTFTPGYVLTRTKTAYQISTLKGDTIDIPFTAIRNIVAVSMGDIKDGAYWPDHSFNHKYWFLPSGFTPGDGQVRMSSYYLSANTVAVGVGSHIQIEAGTDIGLIVTTAINENSWPPGILHLKGAFQMAPELRIGGGIGSVFVPNSFLLDADAQPKAFSFGYGLVTMGHPDAHLTFSYMLAQGRRTKLRHFGSLSIAHRIAPNKMIITENWTSLINGEDVSFLSLGLRTFRRRASFKFSLAGLVLDSPGSRLAGRALVPFPLLGASFRLSK